VTAQVELFPALDADHVDNPDTIDGIGLYDIVDLSSGVLLGKVGITTPEDDRYGYDALWGWATQERLSEKPFRNHNEALEDFLREVAE
jgi:hypothetical protein